jgi:hypothetical protein
MCRHETTRELGTSCYAGPVAAAGDENRAAHGNVCVAEECRACGARRERLVNGCHVEEGPWGPSRAAREIEAREAERVVRALIEARPAPCTLTRGGEAVRVEIDHEGYLVVHGEDRLPSVDDIAAATPALVDYARELRLAALAAQRARADV